MIDRFASPWAFGLMVLVVVVAAVRWRRRAPGVLFSSASLLAGVPTTWRVRVRGLPVVLMLAGLALLIVALARPQKLIGRVPQAGEGIAIEIVLDRSGSMNEEIESDTGGAVTKIDAVKRLIRDFLLGDGKELKGRPDDLVGLVSFARFADTVAPLSRSREILVKLAEGTKLALVRGEDGTAIGEGLALGAARLRGADEAVEGNAGAGGVKGDDGTVKAPAPAKIRSKVLVLMTDGQNNQGGIDPMEGAEIARRWGIKVYTIGVGAGRQRTARVSGLFRDMQIPMGDGVDEDTLRAIAEVTGGRYFAASDTAALRDVYATIDRLERSSLHAPESTLYEELFAPWAMAGGAAALAAGVLRATVLRSLA